MTGIDAAASSISIAEAHASLDPMVSSSVVYRNTTAGICCCDCNR